MTATILLAANVPQVFADSSLCKHQILFLPQTHRMDSDSRNSYSPDMEPIAASQFKVAQYIQQHQGVAVFSEQAAAKDYTWLDYSEDVRAKDSYIVKKNFPRGLPNKFEDMMDVQKYKMIANGADFMALFLGLIPTIHRVIEDEQTATNIFKQTDEWFRIHPEPTQIYSDEIAHLIFTTREKLALEQINSFFNMHPNQRAVILIFGSDHDFSKYPELFSRECVVVPLAFHSDWTAAR